MGLDVYLCKHNKNPNENEDYNEGGESIELPSKVYPDHLFKVGYFRSSYNPSGYNRIVGDMVGIDLYDVFNPGSEYYVQPDWALARERAAMAVAALRKFDDGGGLVSAEFFGESILGRSEPNASDAREAVQVFLEQSKRHREGNGSFSSYSCREGTFYMGVPRKVVGLIEGVDRDLRGQPRQGVWVISRGDMDWYLHAAEIVVETIDHVLGREDRESLWLHWSS